MRVLATLPAVAAALTFTAGTASSATYDVSRNAPSIFGDHGKIEVLMVREGAGTKKTQQTEAGAYDLNARALGGADPIGNFIGWCVNVFTELNFQDGTLSLGNHQSNDGAMSIANDERRGMVEDLFRTSYHLVNPANAVNSAAFQMAIWEIIFEPKKNGTLTLNVANGGFYQAFDDGAGSVGGIRPYYGANSLRSKAEAQANMFLGRLGTTPRFDYDFTWLAAPGSSQPLVTPGPPEVIPLPATAALLLGAIGAFAALRRRA